MNHGLTRPRRKYLDVAQFAGGRAGLEIQRAFKTRQRL